MSNPSDQTPAEGGDVFGESLQESGNKKKTTTIILIAAGALIVLCICLVIAGVLLTQFTDIGLPQINIPFLSGGTNQLLVGVPHSNGESEIFLVSPGQEIDDENMLFEDALEFDGFIGSWDYVLERDFLGSPAYQFGGFIPGTNKILIAYAEDDEYNVYQLSTGNREAVKLIDSDAYLAVVSMENGSQVFILEEKDSGAACYLSKNGQEPERIEKADNCMPSLNGNKVVVLDESSNGEVTITVMDIDGSNPVEIVEDVENLDDWNFSADGSLFVYSEYDDDEETVYLVDTRTAEVLYEEDNLTYLSFIFAKKGNELLLMGENDDSETELYYIKNGEAEQIIEEYDIDADFTGDNRYVVLKLEDDDGDQTISIYDANSGEITELLDGEALYFAILEDPNKILLREEDGDDLIYYSVSFNGKNLVELFDTDDYRRGSEFYLKGYDQLFLTLVDDDDYYALFATSTGSEEGEIVLEEWSSLTIWDISNNHRYLLFSGQEEYDDDPVLCILDLNNNEITELDDDMEYLYDALFGSNENEVFYTVRTGSDYDEIEIRKVNRNGESNPETLYEEAFMIDAGWDLIKPFMSLDWWHYSLY